MAAGDTEFSTEMRGYRKDEVDAAIQELRRELIKANTDRAEAAKEVKRLLAVNEDLQAELDETGSPTYSGLGTKLENTLRVAEEQSTRLIAQADIDAEKLRSTVTAEVTKLRSDAAEEAQR
ncbi:MAG: DivIVA domain-containing protein, partial [Rhodoglobus sp.]|nr:DivIVA domain-containing protein [Rhodoglobus sp.]